MQTSATLALFTVVATVLSLLALEIGAVFSLQRSGVGRRLACGVADYGPALCFIASIIFLLSFQPFADVLKKYRSEPEGFYWQVLVLGNMNPLSRLYEPYILWLLLTIALALIAMIIVVRGLLKRKVDPRAAL